MTGAIFLLSRSVTNDDGVEMQQNVTVYATSANEARALVSDQFARLRRVSNSREKAYQETPAFVVDKVSLDQPKMISAGITG
jgi:hypothetical protein